MNKPLMQQHTENIDPFWLKLSSDVHAKQMSMINLIGELRSQLIDLSDRKHFLEEKIASDESFNEKKTLVYLVSLYQQTLERVFSRLHALSEMKA